MAGSRKKMHQTTVRFGADLWANLEQEAARSGVSAAQFVRDATLARLAYAAGQRGDGFGLRSVEEGRGEGAVAARATSAERESDASAVWTQARLARERSREIRQASQDTQAAIVHAKGG
jgi:hypothetical protein